MALTVNVGATLSSTLTDVPSTSAMPLPGTSLTASAARSTVIFVSVLRSAVSNVTTTFVASVESIATLSMLWSAPPFFTVMSAVSHRADGLAEGQDDLRQVVRVGVRARQRRADAVDLVVGVGGEPNRWS